MKKIYQEPKYLEYSKKTAKKEENRRLYIKAKRKAQRREDQNKPLIYVKKNSKPKRREVIIFAPENFDFLAHPENVTKFINKLENVFDKKRPVFVNMTLVKSIDYCAIAALLSVMYLFKSKGILFDGNFPNDQIIATKLKESGFLYALFENPGRKTSYKIGVDNQLLTQAHSKLSPGLVETVIEDTSNSVWGQKRTCHGLYNVIVELIDNTHEHADGFQKGAERWWLSINHDKKNKKVSFVFLDYGIGIFQSIARKPEDNHINQFLKRIQGKLGEGARDKYLRALLTTKVKKVKADKIRGRGWGLYSIHQATVRNQVNNLYVISNDAFGDVANNNYDILKTGLNGTLFYWELCYNNVSLTKK